MAALLMQSPMSHHLIYNARIYTQDTANPQASAIAIAGERIVAVGAEAAARAAVPADAPATDAGGRAILPGLIDAHFHAELYALSLTAIHAETATLAECLERVRAAAMRTPPGQWLTGHGWNQNVWGGFPSAADLDAVAPQHPVYLQAKSAHAGWANTLALRAANIHAATPNPPNGVIQRTADGTPTGILFEGAMALVSACVPAPQVGQLAGHFRAMQDRLLRLGVTGVHDFDGRRSLAAWQVLREHGDLSMRVTKTLRAAYLDDAIQIGLRSGFGDDWIRLGNVKVFLDGALGPRTARMVEPYLGEPDNYGLAVTDPEDFYELASRAAANGLAMTVHAIGDRANRDLLNAYARLRAEEAGRQQAPLRHRAEHVQLLHPADFNRLGELHIIASMQPVHATSDMDMANAYWGERCAGAYAWRTQLNAGATLAFGSDAPIEEPNPFWGIHAAVTRRRRTGDPGPAGWYPDQRLTVAEAVRAYTLGAAYAGYAEQRLGSLAPGKLADLIVLDRDIYAIDPMDIADTQVLGSMTGGQWRWLSL